MPEKHPNTHRWGGPGASHEDRTKPMPDPRDPRPLGAVGENPRVSQVSGGGGEPDEKHSHVDDLRSSKSHATDSPSPTSTRAWRQNRSRNDREHDAVEEVVAESSTWEADTADLEIVINTDGNVSGRDGVTGPIADRVEEALARFASQLTRVEVYLADENAGKSGGKRCSMEARPKGMDPLAVSEEAATVQDAVAGALDKMARRLSSEFGRRDNRKGGETVRAGEP